jgi:hypothetical protein
MRFSTLIEQPPSPTQLVAILNKYLNDHPEMWGMPASGLARSAFLKSFPAKMVSKNDVRLDGTMNSLL